MALNYIPGTRGRKVVGAGDHLACRVQASVGETHKQLMNNILWFLHISKTIRLLHTSNTISPEGDSAGESSTIGGVCGGRAFSGVVAKLGSPFTINTTPANAIATRHNLIEPSIFRVLFTNPALIIFSKPFLGVYRPISNVFKIN